MTTCELCWAPFPTDADLAAHVEMENAVDWPVDGLKVAGGSVPGCPQPPSGTSRQRNNGRCHG